MAGRRSPLGSLLVVVAALAGGVALGTPDPSALGGYRALMDEAVARMHAAMDVPYNRQRRCRLRPHDDPASSGAIDMASVELRLGKDERLKRLAQEIVVTQQQESR